MNTQQTEKWIPFLIARDGAICNGCKKPLSELLTKVHIDHIDNNPDNNIEDGSNYQLLCLKCNTRKHYRQIQGIEERPYTPEMKLNLKSEPKWVNFVVNEIYEHKNICKNEALSSGAEICNVSTETTKRYLRKRLGATGLFELGWGKCASQLCDETHVYFKGGAPKLEFDGIPSKEL